MTNKLSGCLDKKKVYYYLYQKRSEFIGMMNKKNGTSQLLI